MKAFFYFYKQLTTYTGYIFYINLFGMIFISFFEGIGLFLLIPLINMTGLLTFHNFSLPILKNIPSMTMIPVNLRLPVIATVFILVAIIQAIFQRNVSIRNAHIFIGFVNHLRLTTYKSLLEADWIFFLNKRKSDLINLLTLELSRVSNGTYMTMQLLSSIIFTIIQIFIAFLLSPSITLFVLFWGVIMAMVSRYFIQKSTELGNKTTYIGENYMGGITDHFNGIKDIKTNRLEASRFEWLKNWNQQIEKERLGYIRLKASSQLLYKITSILLVVILFMGTLKFFHAQAGLLLIIILIFSRLWPRFSMLQSNIEQIAASIPAFKYLIEVQKECYRHKEEIQADIHPIILKRSIECKNVSFQYDEKKKKSGLHNINCFIPANRMTAIVGRSGAGKSTFIDIIMGLLTPNEGSILIDGETLLTSDIVSLRQTISYVSQDPFLFNGSIRENLMLVKPDATDQEIWTALDFSQSTDFVMNQDRGLDTMIGDRGIKLSGGERQRLVLARAILRKPTILILDEATSALDAENEMKIQKTIEQMKGKMTIIVIAHRLSTIRKADQVIVLENGYLIEQGPYNTLAYDRNGMFYRLLNFQDEGLQQQWQG